MECCWFRSCRYFPEQYKSFNVNTYSSQWQYASIKRGAEKFAQGAEGVITAKVTKVQYSNHKTGIQVVYDIEFDYFTVEDTKLIGKRRYLDIDGNNPSNEIVPVDGRAKGRTSERKGHDYRRRRHFNNIDSR